MQGLSREAFNRRHAHLGAGPKWSSLVSSGNCRFQNTTASHASPRGCFKLPVKLCTYSTYRGEPIPETSDRTNAGGMAKVPQPCGEYCNTVGKRGQLPVGVVRRPSSISTASGAACTIIVVSTFITNCVPRPPSVSLKA
jgi:hypothetical protein